jgi:hypothetical protein
MESDESDGFLSAATALTRAARKHSARSEHEPTGAHTKARQSSKIRELGDALLFAGFLSLDAQAKALGLPRSTTWTILKGSHKASGLSAVIINRMLAAPHLPRLARTKILEYIEEKTAGLYGGSTAQRRRFAARLSIKSGHSGRGEKEPASSGGRKGAAKT